MKIAPFCKAIEKYNRHLLDPDSCEEDSAIEHILVHTGQHYDHSMSGSFFESLGIPQPDVNLGVGSGSQAEQVGRTMIEFEKVLGTQRPDWVVVLGDVNATLACSITCKKQQIRLAHIEAGLRSFDMGMPEEVNRIVTDRLSDLLFTTDEIASENLRKEGVSDEKIRMVGNIMIDTLEANRVHANVLSVNEILNTNRHPDDEIGKSWSGAQKFSVVTLHRPSNVDEADVLTSIVELFQNEISNELPMVWPVHPRTCQRLKLFGLWDGLCRDEKIYLLQPVTYSELLHLNIKAALMFTDSGGIQEESCVVGTPCLTLRPNTERPVTLMEFGGASLLVGSNKDSIRQAYHKLQNSDRIKPHAPPLWDGRTADRIVKVLAEFGADNI